MNYDGFINQIVKSEPSEWIYDDEFGRYVYKNNICISIISDRSDNEDKEFNEIWATSFSNNKAYRAKFFLCLNGNVIETFYAVAVDGYRCLIPCTEVGTRLITHKKYAIGKILNIPYQNFDEYLNQAKIQIVG